MDEGHECTLGLYLCIGVIQKAGLMSKQRQGKVLNTCVENLIAKADQLRQVHIYIYIYMGPSIQKENRSSTEK